MEGILIRYATQFFAVESITLHFPK
uniref:Uncharacterized protein n=1 Tax=Arundo donax TaxID=35708 RepID=A0A0A9H0A9_ARUDO